MPRPNDASIYQRPIELLQNLVCCDTTNPPGNEAACISYINSLLKKAGIRTTVLGRSRERTNVIARLPGEGKAPPLLLYAHVDVVTTVGQKWQHPPFAAEIADGFLWGRGTLDCKGPVALMLSAFLKAKAEKASLPGDVIFCAVSDEEAGAEYGSRYLVDEHPDLFKGVKYAFGEFGGFNMSMAGKRMYPIMVAEKQCCWMKMTFHGRGGHGSMPLRGQAMAKAARALRLLDRKSLPYHLTPAVHLMLSSIADAFGGATGLAVRGLTTSALSGLVLNALGERSSIFAPLLHNTISPTMLQASEKMNVIPTEVSIGLDGRLLPGFTPQDMKNEIRAVLGSDYDLEVLEYNPGPSAPNMGLFATLGGVLKEMDPSGTAVPYVMSGVTDARFFTKLGIQTYGFTTLRLPDDFNFIATIHTADERIPLDALDFGVEAVYQAMQRFV